LTDIVEHPLERAPGRAAASPNGGERTIAQTGAALFPQLVWAHHRWERERASRDEPDPALERAYLSKLGEFQAEEGRLEEVYWSTRSASAVAMTAKPGRSALRGQLGLSDQDDVIRLHRVSDWITHDAPHIADLLHECDLLAIKVGEVLRGTSERIAMRWILGIEAHLMGFFERATSLPDEKAEREFARRQLNNLAEVEAYYHRAASKAGRIVYVTGMLIGVFLTALLAILGGLLLSLADVDDVEILVLCYGGGAVGALVSAMSRMGTERGKFNIDFELGRPLMRRLGLFRPFVGAVVGVALYFLLASGILDIEVEEAKEPYYYGFAAFLAGFSERFATVIFGAAERRLAPAEDGAGESAKASAEETSA
jgi:hypothetical protein